ncbi:hypothetical protein BSKO_03055 [Bryopsis sp. KO-2023]|nr:hypothetical protein BSKO_03055 [Bryopsis sp. KO-2023]
MGDAWNPFTLRFHSDISERAYATHLAMARVDLHFVTYCVAVLLACIPLEGDCGGAFVLKEISGHAVPAILCYLCVRHKRVYQDWRDSLLWVFQLTGIVYACTKDATLPAAEPELAHILTRISKSPIVAALFHMILLPLRFRHQTLLSTVYILGMIFWSKSLCQSCCQEGDFSEVFRFLGSFSQNAATVVSLTGMGLFMPKLECFSVITFIEVVVGLLLPLYYLYYVEAASRAAYLSRNAGDAEKARILDLKRDCQGWSVWVLGLCIALTWMVS